MIAENGNQIDDIRLKAFVFLQDPFQRKAGLDLLERYRNTPMNPEQSLFLAKCLIDPPTFRKRRNG